MASILDGVGHGKDEVRNGSCAWTHKAKAAIIDCDLMDVLGVKEGVVFEEEGLVEVFDVLVDVTC